MDVYEAQEKVLAYTDYHCVVTLGVIDCLRRRKCFSSFYLHTVLVMKNKEQKAIQTVLVITVGLMLVFWVTQHPGWLYASLSVGIVSLLSSRIAQHIDSVWMKLAHILGLIIPNILLTLVFFLFLWPIAGVSSLFRKGDPLQIHLRDAPTLFRQRHRTFEAKDLENPF
ncbi:MAG: hypothetical protein JNN04_00990 [Cyclobacteriaceae bacterium]|nr:hypothetical protein [Cyclobacteriaceae bacterium]